MGCVTGTCETGCGAIRQAIIIILPMMVDKAVEAPNRLVPSSLWTVRYEPGVPLDVPATDMPFDSTLGAAASTSPSFPALSFFNRSLRYADLEARVDRAAGALIATGVKPGDRVLVALPNCPQFVAAALGSLRAGAVVVPSSHEAPAETALQVIRESPRVAFVSTENASQVATAVAAEGDGTTSIVAIDPAHGLPYAVRWLVRIAGGAGPKRRRSDRWSTWTSWLDRAAGSPERPLIDANAPALEVDGHVFSHANLVSGTAQLRSWLTDAIPGDETWLLLAGLGTPFGFVTGLGAASALRARLALLPAWRPDDVIDAIRYLRPSWVASSASAIRGLADDPLLARVDLRSVRAWIVSEPVEDDVAQRFESASGLALCLGIGAPGVAGLAACNPVNGERMSGTLGTPLPGVQVRTSGQGLDVSGPNIASEGGWLPLLHDGDLGPDGFIRGRSDFPA